MNARRILAAMALCAVLVACGDRDAPGRKASADGGTEALATKRLEWQAFSRGMQAVLKTGYVAGAA